MNVAYHTFKQNDRFRNICFLDQIMLKRMTLFIGVHSKSTFVEEEREGGIKKWTKTNRGMGVLACVYVRFKKKMLEFSRWSFIVTLQLIVVAVWNIKQIIMKGYNIQSCQWMASDCFRQPFLLCTTFRSFRPCSKTKRAVRTRKS